MRFVTHCATPGWSRRVLAAPFPRTAPPHPSERPNLRERSFKVLPGVDTHGARAWHRPSAARRGHLSARERTLGRSVPASPTSAPACLPCGSSSLGRERVVARTVVRVSADHRNCQDPIAKEFCWGIWIGRLSSGNSNL
ncbi:hypothetical protein BT67DRAFT_21415 [Trichocladium antarcticum]|uniref:Uncharacterized protein n=1 Tax=Trichocladium antarcticum TaxID=1450529 RepID=A0AAN6UT55_9PEZI|nr:hypothetical protein BT67DRAFT_21415 [Trichocladium antarcticum]